MQFFVDIYKFLINHEIKLNDANANVYLPHLEEELWSVIIINQNGERLFNNEQYTVSIEDYAVSGTVTSEKIGVNKKNYNLFMDKKVVVRFGFREITGLHAVTVLWYDAKGNLHAMAENMLYDEEGSDEMIYLWFWMDLGVPEVEYPEGLWTMRLFIDGSYVLEDQFSVTKAVTYSKRTIQLNI